MLFSLQLDNLKALKSMVLPGTMKVDSDINFRLQQDDSVNLSTLKAVKLSDLSVLSYT